MPKLEVLVSTFGASGLERALAQGWPHVEGVRYLVCCQNPEGDEVLPAAEALHARGDTDVLFFRDRGLSANRNHSLAAAAAPYVLIMDDDLRLSADGLRAIIATFESRPEFDYLTVRAETGDRRERVFPPAGYDLRRPFRFYNAISFEIALRREAIERLHLRFTLLAGIGAPMLGSGEEDLFLHKLRRRGLRGEYSGIFIGTHEGPTTTEHSAMKPEVVRAKGAVMCMTRGRLGALVRLPLEAHRSQMPFFRALRYLGEGYVYSLKHKKEL
ncbi:MAG: glycosyltransferase family 2 protein [Muribaculaceae bacterium]|nr:glycosyltransferase family 2 protein [Muribaculaceae bacterium]